MHVHVDEAGQHVPALEVEDGRVRARRVGTHRHDPAVLHEDVGVPPHIWHLSVPQRSSAQEKGAAHQPEMSGSGPGVAPLWTATGGTWRSGGDCTPATIGAWPCRYGPGSATSP